MRLPFRRSRRDELVCRELVELATEFLEVALPRRRRRAVERHLARCGACHEYLEQLRAVTRLGREAVPRAGQPTPEVVDELLRLFRESRPA